jgi:hypothetical protein
MENPKFVGYVTNPNNDIKIEIYKGFSFPNLFFGVMHFGYKEAWNWVFISFVVGVLSSGFSLLVFPFFANKIIAKSLVMKGFIPDDNVKKYLEIK